MKYPTYEHWKSKYAHDQVAFESPCPLQGTTVCKVEIFVHDEENDTTTMFEGLLTVKPSIRLGPQAIMNVSAKTTPTLLPQSIRVGLSHTFKKGIIKLHVHSHSENVEVQARITRAIG